MNFLTNVIARVLYGVPFGVFGLLHFVMAQKMASSVPSFVPGGVTWVYIIGAALIAACIAIVGNILIRPAAFCLALLLATFVVTIHLPALAGDPEHTSMALINLLKDVSLAGAALIVAGRNWQSAAAM